MVIVRPDAGPRGPQIDGVVIDDEWDGATIADEDVATDRPGSVLTRMRALIDDGRLFVAVEGTLASGDALVVYVDRALGSPDGVADPSDLSDESGALDAALSETITTPSELAADFAFGTTLMSHTAAGLDDTQGWRDLSDPTSFRWIAAETAPMACGDAGCEAAIGLDELGGTAPRTIAIFARIVRAEGGLTNQTLPSDDASDPTTVSALLTVDEGIVIDAGMELDAGIDAGPSDVITIDGTIDSAEWGSATRYTSSTLATTAFAGNRLSALYARRDATRLYFAVEATLTSGNAIAVYVDHDLGQGDGLASPTPLDDLVGELDRALSKTMFTPAELRLDFAWGTLEMSRTAMATDDRMGWREVGLSPASFRAIDGTRAPSACSASACEASISLSDLGVLAGDSLALYVRLVSATSSAMSNQTLPMDDPAGPELISTYLVATP
jgi:hypothetical protein